MSSAPPPSLICQALASARAPLIPLNRSERTPQSSPRATTSSDRRWRFESVAPRWQGPHRLPSQVLLLASSSSLRASRLRQRRTTSRRASQPFRTPAYRLPPRERRPPPHVV